MRYELVAVVAELMHPWGSKELASEWLKVAGDLTETDVREMADDDFMAIAAEAAANIAQEN